MVKLPGKASDFLKIGVAAAARGDIDLVREVLRLRPDWIHRLGSHGRTMLWEACHRGKLSMVKYLVRRKADLDAFGTHYTPYFVEISCYCIARHKQHDDVAEYLLEKGAKRNIHTAAFLGETAAVRKYLRRSKNRLDQGHPQCEMAEKGSEVAFRIVDAHWATPLCYALRGGGLDTVEYLISQGARIRGLERWLFIAANDDPGKVRLLLENGADPKFAPQATPDDGELFEIVSAHGGKRPSQHQLGEELVYLCRGDRGGNPEQVRRLLSLGASVDHQDKKGKTALHRAARAGFLDAMSVLLDHGARVDLADQAGNSPLDDALASTIKDRKKNRAAVKLLKANGAVRSK